MISVRVHAKKALARWSRFASGFLPAVERGLSQTAFRRQRVAQSKSKGSVSRSVGVRQTPGGYELSARAPHAGFVEHGRGPVEASSGKVLRFVVNGRVFFRKRVGPARARPFMAPAARAMNTPRFVEMSLARLARGVS